MIQTASDGGVHHVGSYSMHLDQLWHFFVIFLLAYLLGPFLAKKSFLEERWEVHLFVGIRINNF